MTLDLVVALLVLVRARDLGLKGLFASSSYDQCLLYRNFLSVWRVLHGFVRSFVALSLASSSVRRRSEKEFGLRSGGWPLFLHTFG